MAAMVPDMDWLYTRLGVLLFVVLAGVLSHFSSKEPRSSEKRALVCVQAFPPLLKSAGGVSKRYLTLCRALINVGWKVTIMTPVDVTRSKEPEVDEWLRTGQLTHLPARGVRMTSTDGIAVFLDVFSFYNGMYLLRELIWRGGYDVLIADDIPWRFALVLICRAAGVPSVVTSHTDATQLKSFRENVALGIVWKFHMLSAHLADIHATVSRVFGDILRARERAPVQAVWPPILWSSAFQDAVSKYEEAAAELRGEWEAALKRRGVKKPRTLFLYAGRWSSEKRIRLLFPAVPADCALVVVGDGSSDYCEDLVRDKSVPANVLLRRKMLNAVELRTAYAAADVFVSASNFETLGNTVIEAWCSGTAPAIQNEQGHLEYCKDGQNGFLLSYDDADAARKRLQEISDGELWRPEALPGLKAQGAFFRDSNFPRMFLEAIVIPAEQATQRRRGTVLETVHRGSSLLVWLALWPLFRGMLRLSFLLMSLEGSVKCEVLGRLGSSVEVTESDSEYKQHFKSAQALGWRHGKLLPAL